MISKICLLSFTVLNHVVCVVIDIPPSNMTVFEGDDAILQCKTLRQQPGELVVWKKISEFSGKLLSINNRSTDNRVHIRGAYDLVIRDVTVSDDGIYLCDAERNSAMAYLSVSVPMEELTLTSDVPMPLDKDDDVNLTCRSRHSHPPADLRWFKGQSQMFGATTFTTKIYQSDGFGDCESTITVRMSSGERDIPFRCVADLPAKSAIRETFFFPSVASDGSQTELTSSQCIVIMTIFVSYLTVNCLLKK